MSQGTYERIVMTEAGTLRDALLDRPTDRVDSLTVSGPINSADLSYLHEHAGLIANMYYLDLADAVPVIDGEVYYTRQIWRGFGAGTEYTYFIFSENDYVEPVTYGGFTQNSYKNCYNTGLAYAFNDINGLKELRLPNALKNVGEGICYDTPLESVTLPAGTRKIGASAFYNSTLHSVHNMESVDSIGPNAFAFTRNLTDISIKNVAYLGRGCFDNSGIKSVALSDRLTAIDVETFHSCQQLESIAIPGTAASIGESAFYGCSKLQRVVIGEGTKRIDARDFGECRQLADITMPSTLEGIGRDAFDATPWLARQTAEDGIVYIKSIVYKATDALRGAENVAIKEGTTAIGDGAFAELDLKAVSLPASLRVIGSQAFKNNPISTVTLPGALTDIGVEAFWQTNLSSITIPASVERLGDASFGNCNALVRVNFNAINAVCYGNMKEMYINPFNDSKNIVRVNFGEGVKRIPNYLFADRVDLTTCELPPTTESIGAGAFRGCTNLKTIKLPDGLTTINVFAFQNCKSLQPMPLPDGIETIGYRAFNGCTQLDVTGWPLSLRHIGGSAFESSGVTSISLPTGVETIGDYAFADCTKAVSVFLPATIKDVGIMSINNNPRSHLLTCMALTPPAIELYSNLSYTCAQLRVPAQALEAYQADGYWGKFEHIVGIGTVEPQGQMATHFGAQLTDGSGQAVQLTDTVISNVYYTLPDGDGYDTAEQCIVINSTMTDDQMAVVSTLRQGVDDVAARFDGILIEVPAGDGSLKLDVQTMGSGRLSVKVGQQEAQMIEQNSRGTVQVTFTTSEPSHLYIYGATPRPGEQQAGSKALRRVATTVASDNSVKLYSFALTPIVSDINGLTRGTASAESYYSIDGRRIPSPQDKGIYIVKMSDGTAKKILVR